MHVRSVLGASFVTTLPTATVAAALVPALVVGHRPREWLPHLCDIFEGRVHCVVARIGTSVPGMRSVAEGAGGR
jgi:hypothetical protein